MFRGIKRRIASIERKIGNESNPEAAKEIAEGAALWHCIEEDDLKEINAKETDSELHAQDSWLLNGEDVRYVPSAQLCAFVLRSNPRLKQRLINRLKRDPKLREEARRSLEAQGYTWPFDC